MPNVTNLALRAIAARRAIVPRRAAAGLLLGSAVVVLAACGSSGGSSGSSGTPSAAASVSASVAAAPATGSTVTIQNFAFAPKALTVATGTTVVWTNKDSATHTVTSTDKTFDSGDLVDGKTFSYTFKKAGTYSYICSIHQYMTGTVVVN